MHLNHVLLATAIALFVNIEGVVTAGNPESLHNHNGLDDGSSALDPDRAAVIAAKTPSTKSGIMLAPDSSLDDESESSEWTSSSGSNDGLGSLVGQGSNSFYLDFDPTFLIAGMTPTTKKGVMAASDSASGDDDDDMESWSGSSDEDSGSSDSTGASGSGNSLGGLVGQGINSFDLDFDPTFLIAGKTPTTKKGLMAASDSASSDNDDNMESWGSSDADSDSSESTGASGSGDGLGGLVDQVGQDSNSNSLDLDFDPTFLIAGMTPTTKKGVMAASDSASGDDDDDIESWSGSSDEDSGSSDSTGSSDEDSGSSDSTGSSEEDSGSFDISGSSSEQDDLFSVDGSGFDDFLKALGLSSGSLDFYMNSGSLDSKKASKKTKHTSSSASASSEMMDFDDFFADMKGSGLGGGLGGLKMPPATDAPAASGSPSASGSGKVTPECKEGWWSKTKAWFGSFVKVTTDKDCPPAPAPQTRKLRGE
uniref:RxLR effector candidate protein n=1 Tax=Hyaloperonospora arabidopsidis (strain Emoy2) TaxID=559515 RepID=M4BCN2_HYAAE